MIVKKDNLQGKLMTIGFGVEGLPTAIIMTKAGTIVPLEFCRDEPLEVVEEDACECVEDCKCEQS